MTAPFRTGPISPQGLNRVRSRAVRQNEFPLNPAFRALRRSLGNNPVAAAILANASANQTPRQPGRFDVPQINLPGGARVGIPGPGTGFGGFGAGGPEALGRTLRSPALRALPGVRFTPERVIPSRTEIVPRGQLQPRPTVVAPGPPPEPDLPVNVFGPPFGSRIPRPRIRRGTPSFLDLLGDNVRRLQQGPGLSPGQLDFLRTATRLGTQNVGDVVNAQGGLRDAFGSARDLPGFSAGAGTFFPRQTPVQFGPPLNLPSPRDNPLPSLGAGQSVGAVGPGTGFGGFGGGGLNLGTSLGATRGLPGFDASLGRLVPRDETGRNLRRLAPLGGGLG